MLFIAPAVKKIWKALNQVLEELRIPAPKWIWRFDLISADFKPHIAPQKFEQMVETARGLIRNAIRCSNAVLSQRFSAEVTGNPFDFYRNSATNPSNYLLFLRIWDYQTMELGSRKFGFWLNGIRTTNPIAGDIALGGATDEEDKVLATTLLSTRRKQNIGCW